MNTARPFLCQLSKIYISTTFALSSLFMSQAFAQQKPTISGISSGGFMSVQMATIYSNEFSGVGTIAGGFFFCSQNHLQDKIEEGRSNLFAGGSRNLLKFEPTDKFFESSQMLFVDTSEQEKWFIPAKKNPIYQAVGVCMANPANADLPDLKKMADEGKIDAISSFKNLNAYIYQGASDTVVNKDMVTKLTQFYTDNGIDGAQIKTTFGTGGHNFPTDKLGLNACKAQDVPYISSCGMDIAKETLEQTMQRQLEKSTPDLKNLYVIDQTLDNKNKTKSEDKWSQPETSLAPYGYLYASAYCVANPGSCQLHVALHGCKMSDSFSEAFESKYTQQVIQTSILEMRTQSELSWYNGNLPTIEEKENQYGTLKFAVNSGYIDYAEKNNLMILFPQTWITEKNYPYNPKGCWDWFGWTGREYATNKGKEAAWMIQLIQAIQSNPSEKIMSVKPHFEAIGVRAE